MSETALKLRCPLSECESMKIEEAPSPGYTAGQLTKVEDMVGVIVEAAKTGEEAVLIYKAPKIVVPKVAGTGKTIAAGAKVYYKAASAAVTGDSTSNTLCGRCLVAAGATDTEVEIDLNGAVAA